LTPTLALPMESPQTGKKRVSEKPATN
jgi:hypothetical protein